MKVLKIVFSPTGGTQRVADMLAEELGEVWAEVDLTDMKTAFSKVYADSDTIAVIAVPTFGGRAPEAAMKRLSEIKGGGSKAVAVCVYGNRDYGDALIEIYDTAAAAGFEVTAAIAAVAEHSIMRHYAAGRPNENDRKIFGDFAAAIKEKIHKGHTGALEVNGNRPYKKYCRIGIIPSTSDDCINCGACAPACPVGATDSMIASNIDADKCISCMRCVVRCPYKARSINLAMVRLAEFATKEVCSVNKSNELFI